MAPDPVYSPGMDHEAWTRFMNGHWTRERPTKVGTYPTATSEGNVCGSSSWAVAYPDPKTGKPTLVTTWGGYFWSEPMPELPPVKATP